MAEVKNDIASFFSQESGVDETPFLKNGEEQIRDREWTRMTAEDEDAECRSFIEWTSTTTQKFRKQVKSNVRCVSNDVEEKILSDTIPSSYSVSISDFAPNSAMGDDIIYEKYHDVWEKLPRGCAMVQIKHKTSGETLLFWGARANRKFTGHEDEGATDSALYTVDTGSSAEHALVTLKENGQVLHLAVRTVSLPKNGGKVSLLIVGSKKVHAVLPLLNDWKEMGRRLRLYEPQARYGLVADMFDACEKHVSSELLSFLDINSLVLNSEFVVPSGSGPVDNTQIHSIKEPTPFGFCFSVNRLACPRGTELCINPVYGLKKLKELGFPAVSGFLVPVEELENAKRKIAHLPVVEGGVVYHISSNGTTRLEKAKASGYVVVRAIREKVKGFLSGRKKKKGVVQALKDIREGEKKLLEKIKAKKDEEGLSATIDQWWMIKDVLEAAGGEKQNKGNTWRFPKDVELGDIISKYTHCQIEDVKSRTVPPAQDSIERRVKEIDHVPITEKDREEWIRLGKGFVEWLFQGVLEERFDLAGVVEHFSSTWSTYVATSS